MKIVATHSIDADTAYVAFGDDREVVETIALGYDADVKPVGMALNADGSTLYVANGRANTVSVVDPSNGRISKTIAVGQRVWGIAFAHSSGKLYAANGLSNNVSVIDTNSNSVVATLPAGDGPWGVAIRE